MENPTLQMEPTHVRNRRQRIIVWILLILAGTEFVARGPLRYLKTTDWNDLAQYYTSSRLWLRGQDFTNGDTFTAMWQQQTGILVNSRSVRVHLAPPPGALLLLAPIGLLSWPGALIVWLAVLLASVALTVWALLGTSGLSVRQSRGLVFLTGCLALAPFHTGLASGNQTILVVGLCCLGIWAEGINCDTLAGVFLGIACSLKPHLAAFVVLYYLVQRQWRLFVTAVGVTAALASLAAAWMQFSGIPWIAGYRSNIRMAATKNTIDDFTTANPIRFMLINLQVPIYSFTHAAKSANLVALSVGGIMILAWMLLLIRQKQSRSGLLPLSAICVIGLLPVYHRLYDASLLVIPLCWCLNRPTRLRRIAQFAVFLIIPFLVPGAAVLQQAVRSGYVPEAWTHFWVWDRVLMPHQTWLLLLLSLVLLYGMALESNLRTDPLTDQP